MEPESKPGELGPDLLCSVPGSSLQVSRLGFGTSALMSRVSRRDSRSLLETALEEGITHFDTARSYGFGEAELAVGDLLRGRRDRITVTTKTGILPPRRSALVSLGKAAARRVLGLAPGLRPAVRNMAGQLITAGRFDAESMTASLHTSLRQLRTDYVDILLLHECSAGVLASGEPLEFLQRVQKEGKTRRFGIAAPVDVALFAVEHAPEYAGVLQLPNSAVQPSIALIEQVPERMILTHSALGDWTGRLRAFLCGRADLAAIWSKQLGVEVLAPGLLERLALQYALWSLPEGVVLFTSTRRSHIQENAETMREPIDAARIEAFERLVADWAGNGAAPRGALKTGDSA